MLSKLIQKDESNLSSADRLTPERYYMMRDLINSISTEDTEKLDEIIQNIKKLLEETQDFYANIHNAAVNFHQSDIVSLKRNHNINMFGDLTSGDDADDNSYNFRDNNFILILGDILQQMCKIYQEFLNFAKNLKPPYILSSEERIIAPKNHHEFQAIHMEMQINSGVVNNYMSSLISLYWIKKSPERIMIDLNKRIENFYGYLHDLHVSKGFDISINPIVTNVAMHIFENIDRQGDVDRTTGDVSAYTMQKAKSIASALLGSGVRHFLKEPDMLHALVSEFIRNIIKNTNDVTALFNDILVKSKDPMLGMALDEPVTIPKQQFDKLTSMHFSDITYNESPKIKDNVVQLGDKIRQETISKVANMILNTDTKFTDLVDYILSRKRELKKFYFEDNSFYVCRIGQGNPFLGLSPGAIEVVPADRPTANFDDIMGSGFSEIRDFFSTIESSSKFHELFKVTSPSNSADKSNVLMVGPQGCGKTQVLRAVGADPSSIGIFAQGSDFLTCWKGEAEKNPKRLFQEGLRLSKDSGRHVHFLIDEIDSLLNNDNDLSGNTNLTMEFQILMDGVVSYPNLSVWGATNNINRIPMPMIRRFSKVLIVGELTDNERAILLEKFMNYMPLSSKIKRAEWLVWGKMLDGATGDVVRKIADHLWRVKMNNFIKNHTSEAEMMTKLIASEDYEPTAFRRKLSKYVSINSEDITKSIKMHLDNIAIKSEIMTAQKTYNNAREYLQQMKEISI